MILNHDEIVKSVQEKQISIDPFEQNKYREPHMI